MQYIRKICILKQVSAGVCGGRQDALRPAHGGELRRAADRDARRDRACAPLGGAVPRRLMRRARHGRAVRPALPRGLYRKAAERPRTLGRTGLRAAVRERRGEDGRLRQERRTRLRPCGAVRARRRIAAAARRGRGGRDATDGRGKNGDGQPCRKPPDRTGKQRARGRSKRRARRPTTTRRSRTSITSPLRTRKRRARRRAERNRGAETPSEGVSDAQTGGAAGKAQADGRDAGEDEDAQSLFRRAGSEERGADEELAITIR